MITKREADRPTTGYSESSAPYWIVPTVGAGLALFFLLIYIAILLHKWINWRRTQSQGRLPQPPAPPLPSLPALPALVHQPQTALRFSRLSAGYQSQPPKRTSTFSLDPGDDEAILMATFPRPPGIPYPDIPPFADNSGVSHLGSDPFSSARTSSTMGAAHSFPPCPDIEANAGGPGNDAIHK